MESIETIVILRKAVPLTKGTRCALVAVPSVPGTILKIQKWGNSQGLRVSKEMLEQVHAAVGDAVEVSVQKGAIFIQPIKRLRGRYNLRQLVAQMPKNYKPGTEEWGKPVGKEIW